MKIYKLPWTITTAVPPTLVIDFTVEVNNSLEAIAKMPEAYGYRYKNVRAKLLYKFPFLIFFKIDDKKFIVEVLRIFHASQEPYWL